MEKPASGEISLFDLTGRKVCIFFKGDFKQGINRLHFGLDGLNSGLYFMVVDAGREKQVKKLMVR